MRVLLIEHDPDFARRHITLLEQAQFSVNRADSQKTGFEWAVQYAYNIIVLQLDRPEVTDGIKLIRQLRKQRIPTPILALTHVGDPLMRAAALNSGADDCQALPIDNKELVARILAIDRRAKDVRSTVIETGKVVVDVEAKTVKVEGEPVPITGYQYQTLELLSLRKGMTLTKETIFDHLYNGQDEPQREIVDVFVCKIRKKLAEATGGENYIVTVWGQGYELRDPGSKAPEKDAAE